MSEGGVPFERLLLLRQQRDATERRALDRLRREAYVPDGLDDERAWAHIGRFLAMNFMDVIEPELIKRPRGRPRESLSLDQKRAIAAYKVQLIQPIEEEQMLSLDFSPISKTFVASLIALGKPIFPHRADRAIEDSIRKGIRELRSRRDTLLSQLQEAEERRAFAARYNDTSWLDEINAECTRKKSEYFSLFADDEP